MTMEMVKNDYENGQKRLWKWLKMIMKMAKNDYENGQKWLWKWLKMTMKTEESQKWSLGLRKVVLTSYDEIESCREWKVESSHMCKNSSRRTPRPKNLIFLVLWAQKRQTMSLGPYDKLKNVWIVILKVLK